MNPRLQSHKNGQSENGKDFFKVKNVLNDTKKKKHTNKLHKRNLVRSLLN